MRVITKTVWILSLVSLFTDMASEMLYPIMPLFLKQIGYSAIFIGVLEGVAEAVAGLTKSYFGKRSDAMGKRLPFIQLGYGLSAISKPMLAIFIYPWWVFFSRTTDRLGKGIRTGARDAMLSDECNPETKGRVFGFHRSMDTLGAVFGPAIALIYLYFNPEHYQMLFIIAVVPGVLAIISTLFIKEFKKQVTKKKEIVQASLFAFTSYWKGSPANYKKLVAGLLLFALINSSDIFLLLKMKESGQSDTVIIGIYIFYNLVYAICAYPLGILADKIGLKSILITGLCIFSIVYTGFALNENMYVFFLLFALYGIYAAATEGISKAWISNLVPKNETASALGTFSGFQSICALIASSLCGLLWYHLGAVFTFLVTAVISLAVIIYLYFLKITDSPKP
ncbi:MAG: MFS transporter [Ferruginibacter sp.]|jgi:MFS family permease|nr:MFS transporter [Ferruginibacter sp.]